MYHTRLTAMSNLRIHPKTLTQILSVLFDLLSQTTSFIALMPAMHLLHSHLYIFSSHYAAALQTNQNKDRKWLTHFSLSPQQWLIR